jgi:hypothetical protein
LGAPRLLFEERSGGWNPLDRLDLPVVHDDLLDDDSAELLATSHRCHGDRTWQSLDPSSVSVEGADPVVVGQRREGCLHGVPLGEIRGVGQIAPAVLLFQLLEASGQPRPLTAAVRDGWCLEPATQFSLGGVDDPLGKGSLFAATSPAATTCYGGSVLILRGRTMPGS